MRLFVALELPAEVKERIEALKKELPSEGLSLVKKDRMHATLKFLGEVEDASKITEALSQVNFAPFTLNCRGVGAFPSKKLVRVIWAGVRAPELKALALQINDSLAPLGFEKEQFTGHATIARVKKKTDLRAFLEKHAEDEFGEFTVDSFVLKKSTLTPQGPIYEDVKEFKASE